MAHLTRRLTVILTLFLLASSLCLAKGPRKRAYVEVFQHHDAPMPQEVLSAKTVALVVKIVAGPESNIADYKQRIEADLSAEIQKRSRFQLVSDPAKADLVCMLIGFSDLSWHDAYQAGKGFWGGMHGRVWNRIPPAAIVVFKGGNDPYRTARPVWMKTSYMSAATPGRLMNDFNAAFAKAEKKQGSQAKYQQTPEVKPYQSMITGLTPMPHGDAERNYPVFCRVDQPCRFPQEISSAGTVLVCDPIHVCNDGFVQEDVTWGGRWKLVDDPRLADLIIVLCWTPSNSSEARDFVYAGMYVFKGGEKPDWNSMPMYIQFGHDHDTLLMNLENMVAEAHR